MVINMTEGEYMTMEELVEAWVFEEYRSGDFTEECANEVSQGAVVIILEYLKEAFDVRVDVDYLGKDTI